MASRVHGACDLENDARGAIQKRVRWSARAGGGVVWTRRRLLALAVASQP